jgi:ketosteroid isomerase-like protein
MSEQQNVELVEKAYAGFSRGDIAAILDLLAPDVKWTLEGPAVVPYTGTFVGPAEVAKFFAGIAATQTNTKLTVSEFIAQGEKVVGVGRYSSVVVATGRKIDSAVAHVFTIQDGKITRFLDFGDTAQMLEAHTGGAVAGA